MLYSADIGKLVLRITIAVLLLFHGIDKIGHLGGIIAILGKNGLPEVLAYAIYIGEIIAPIMLLVGYRIRIAALIISATLFSASVLAYSGKFFSLGDHGAYALEVQSFYVIVGIAIFFLGNDRFCIDARRKH